MTPVTASGTGSGGTASTVDVTDRAARLVGHVTVDSIAAGQPIDVTDRAGRLLGIVASITSAVDISDRAGRALGVIASITNPVDISDRAGRALGVIASITAALPAGANTIGAVNQTTGQGKTLLFASVSTAASGQTAIVAASGGNKTKVVSYVLVASAAVTAQWQSGATGLSGAMALAANGGISAVGQPSAHLFETAVNTALNLNLGGAVQVSGHIAYIQEP